MAIPPHDDPEIQRLIREGLERFLQNGCFMAADEGIRFTTHTHTGGPARAGFDLDFKKTPNGSWVMR